MQNRKDPPGPLVEQATGTGAPGPVLHSRGRTSGSLPVPSGRVPVHAAAQSLDVVADVRNHAVPLVPFRGRGLVIRAARGPVSGAGGGGAQGSPVPAKAVSDDASAVLHPYGLEEVLEVLAVLLRDEGPQTCGHRVCLTPGLQRGERPCPPCPPCVRPSPMGTTGPSRSRPCSRWLAPSPSLGPGGSPPSGLQVQNRGSMLTPRGTTPFGGE